MESDKGLQIRLLGSPSVSCGGIERAYNGRTPKMWLFLAYLLINRQRMVSRQELIEALNIGEDSTDPARTLRNLRLRARHTLAELSGAAGCDLIVSDADSCGWNSKVPAWWDIDEFEDLCRREDAESLHRAVALYTGPLLACFSTELWVIPLAEGAHRMYLDALDRLLALLEAEGKPEKIVALCRAAMQKEPYNEDLCRSLMRALMTQGRCAEAERTYEDLRSRLFGELDLIPEEETQALHREVMRKLGTASLSLEEIRGDLRRADREEGVQICSYDVFKLFYQVESRSAGRRGDAIHIGLFTVESKGDAPLSDAALSRAMDQVSEDLVHNLRTGDLACRCSPSQFLILLVRANAENSSMVTKRIEHAFRLGHPHSPARVRCAVLPLEPLLPGQISLHDNFETDSETPGGL